MNRQDYLNDVHVEDFLKWMGPHLQAASPLGHGYSRPGAAPARFANLAAAFEAYDWAFSFERQNGSRCAGSSFAENARVLGELQQRLRKGVDRGDDAATCAAAIEVVSWGGVAPHNAAWLRANRAGLAACLARVGKALGSDDDAPDLGHALRFNAGMTKVYSLLLDHFIIYDSRVAGALAWFIAAWARERNAQAIPDSLKFPCMPAKEAPNAARRKQRNPWDAKSGFPYVRNRAHVHAMWNRRASWIVRALLDNHPDAVFGPGTGGSRRMEAALFMWGYDLTAWSPQRSADGEALLQAA